MKLGFLTSSKINKSKFAAVMLLNLGTLSWFFLLNLSIGDIFAIMIPNTPEWGIIGGTSLLYGFAIFWSVAISFIGRKINRRKLLFSSIILGIFSTVLLAFVDGVFFASIIVSLMGTSLGLGLPSSMALVADYTVVENRGRASGVVILSTFVITFASVGVYEMLGLGVLYLILILAVLRSISLFALVIGKLGKPLTASEKQIRLPSNTYREFLFYLCPWVMFTLAASLANNLVAAAGFESEAYFGTTYLRFVFIAVFGLFAGFIADRYGRKQPIIFGLATMGIGYLLLSFNMTGTSVIIYYALSGITWGLFFVIFFVMPGDLSTPSSRDKFYALGYILPLIGILAPSVIPVTNIQEIISSNQIALIAGVCLFLAMYPVFRAKETLTESQKRERTMKEYIEKLEKTIQQTEENSN